MDFEEFKEKVNRRFGRKLSDREIAEVAIESMNNANEAEEALFERNESLEQQLSELKAAMPRASAMTGIEATVAERVCEVLSLESNTCDIEITKDCDGIYMDFKVYGHPLVKYGGCPNEDEEE
jgi:seryl-tRNA synthetase